MLAIYNMGRGKGAVGKIGDAVQLEGGRKAASEPCK